MGRFKRKGMYLRGTLLLGCLVLGLLAGLVSAEFGSNPSNTFYLPVVSYEFTDLTWTEVGVPNVIETTFEIDPNRPNTIYVGSTDYQGAWRSHDGGQSWEIMGNGLPVTAKVRYIATAPVSPTFVFAGVWGIFRKSFRSWDGGDSWEAGTRPHDYPISALAVNPVMPTTVFWGNGVWDSPTVGGEVFRSTNGGDNWSEILPLGTMAIDIVVDPMSPNIVYMSIGSGLPVPWLITVVIHPDVPEMMFSTPFEGSEYFGICQSLDGGFSWQWIAPNPVNHYVRKMMVQNGAEASLFVLFNGYLNDDGRLWKLDLVP